MIREAIKNDINAISSLLKELNALHIQLAPERYKFSAEEVNCAFINGYFDQDTKFIFVAEENSHVAGVAFLSVKTEHRDSPSKNTICAFLDTIVVAANCKRNGVGRDLIKKVEKKARQMSCSALKINVAIENNNALAFYKCLGYDPSDIQLIKRFY
jgi:N-acetylglutamate synthase-like GNAT family acetyltransferase